MQKASCSSKRDDSGLSNGSAPGVEAESRHRNFRPGVSSGNGEGHGVFRRVGRNGLARIHRLLVGVGRQRGQHPGSPDDDAVGRLADLADGDLVAHDLAIGALVDGGLDDRMGEGNVGLAQTALEVHDIARATLVAPVGARPHLGRRGEGCELHVHVVRRAAHDAHRAFRQPDEAGMAAPEVVLETAGSCG